MEAGFLPGSRGALFYVLYRPPAGVPPRGGVLHVHPFAEELNKARPMIARQARRLAEAGFVVLVPDHFGCGDSAGDFGDASWEGWLDDLERAARQLATEAPGAPVLWGLRTGCLLIDALLAERGLEACAQVYWQPVQNGDTFLNQFLRLRLAADMMTGGSKETTASMRERLQAGETLEVAGYALSPAMAEALQGARLSHPPITPVCWLDVVAGPEPRLSPASRKTVDAWSGKGCPVSAEALTGEPFWTTQEIREVPLLLERTCAYLEEQAQTWNVQPSSN